MAPLCSLVFKQSKHVRATPLARQPHVSPAFADTLLLLLGLAVETLAFTEPLARLSLLELLLLEAMRASEALVLRRVRVC